jgi:hypothetical protein
VSRQAHHRIKPQQQAALLQASSRPPSNPVAFSSDQVPRQQLAQQPPHQAWPLQDWQNKEQLLRDQYSPRNPVSKPDPEIPSTSGNRVSHLEDE